MRYTLGHNQNRIQKICAHYFRESPSEIKEISTGLFNDSYIIEFEDPIQNISNFDIHNSPSKREEDETRQKKKLVVRIAPPDDAGFIFYEKRMMRQEPRIHKLIRARTSIPVPQILVANFQRNLVSRDFLIMEYLKGTPLSSAQRAYSHFSNTQLQKAYYQTGQYVREAHAIHSDLYGYIGVHSPSPPNKSWWDAFRVMWRFLEDGLVDCGAYSPKEAEKFLNALDRHKDSFTVRENVPSSLLHMDVWAQNILVDEKGNVTGIVDWDRSLSGDPEIEYAVLDYCGFNNDAFWEGYGEQPEEDKDSRIRMKFYLLYEHQKYIIIRTYRRPDRSAVRRYKSDSLRILSSLI